MERYAVQTGKQKRSAFMFRVKQSTKSHTFLESLTLRKTPLLNVGNQLPVDTASHQNNWTIVNTAVRSSNLATTLTL